jgi:hypothetical protein
MSETEQKSNSIRQHRPDFVEGYPKALVEFDTLEELLAIPWVKNFSVLKTFHRYSVSGNCLIAEYRNGREWWVVGLLKNNDVGLPKWDHGIYECWVDGRARDIPGHDVSWSRGDQVGLRDGRVVKRRREP